MFGDDLNDTSTPLEPVENLHQRLAERFEAMSKVQTSCTPLQGTDPALPAEPFHTALMISVLEDIDDDLAVLQHLYTLLRPGGRVRLFVPALPWRDWSLDALVHHVRGYTRTELRERMQEAGFTIDALTYFDLLGILPWFFAGRLFRRQQFYSTGAEL